MSASKEYFVKSSTRFTNADAKVIGPVLGSLAEQGPVTARDVLETAHSANSPLHKYFEWDDAKAAEQHRLAVARDMVRTVRVRVVTPNGPVRQFAAQRMVVKSVTALAVPPKPIISAQSVVLRPEPRSAPSHEFARKVMDDTYFPDDIEEACDIIAELRERLAVNSSESEETGRHELGMTGKEFAVYEFLKRRGFASKRDILSGLYGVGDNIPEIKIVDVFICKLRAKLPMGERIETVWGEGYKWVVDGDEETPDAPKRRFTDHAELDPTNVKGLPDDNAAIIEGRTLFPSTVVDPADSPALLVSGENSRKLGGHVTKGPWAGFPIYQLSLEERATCPRSCRVWNQCYGNGMQMARRHRNTPDLLPYLRAELLDLQDEFPRGFVVRLHVLGDFYSVEYVEAWEVFLEDFPALHIFGYTAWQRGTPIGDAVKHITDRNWERFTIRFSSAEPQPQGATTIWRMPEDDTVWEGIVCPAQTDKTDCCGTCGLCWSISAKEKTIVFVGHGRKAQADDGRIKPLSPQQMMVRR